jgi:hypothetical protein
MYISYNDEHQYFYLMRNRDDFMNWIIVDYTGLSDEDEQKIKDADEALSCSIQIELD